VRELLRKPDIERLKTAIKGGMADRVPNFEICIEARTVEHLLGRRVGSTMVASRGAVPTAQAAGPMDARDYVDVCRLIGQDAIGIEAGWAPLRYRDDRGDLRIITDSRLKSLSDFERVVLPSWDLDYQPKIEQLKNYRSAVEGTGIGVFFAPGCLFQTCYQFLIGFEDFFEKLYSDRPFIEAVLNACMDYYLRVTEAALEIGIDVLWLGDDIAFRTGALVDPLVYRSMWLPRMRRLVKLGKEAGLPVVFHSCGNLTPLMDSVILPLGADCLNPIEPYSMDIFEIKRNYGARLAISGNIDIAGPLATGTPEQVRKIVQEHLSRLMPGGGYILSSSHSITDDIPPENFLAMIDTVINHGTY
jgi:hypothetical protein